MSRTGYRLGFLFIFLIAAALLAAAAPAVPAAERPVLVLQVTPEATATPVEGGTPPEGEAGESTSSLPEGLAAIFASLGLYIVTMFTMAIGTEIVVDVVKLGIGLKSKPTARKSIEEYKNFLPGSLASLGASAEAQKQFQKHLESLDKVLEPAAKTEEFLAQLQEGYLGEAVKSVLAQAQAGALPTKEQAQTAVKEHLCDAVTKLTMRLGLDSRLAQPLIKRLDEAVDSVASADPQKLLVAGVTFLQGEIALLVTTWARQQTSLLAAGSRKTVEQKYYSTFRPQLKGLGLDEPELAALDDWFVTFLNRFEGQAGQQVEIYLASLNELLKGVERQRYLIQSPARKAWRRLATMPGIGPILKGIEKWWNRMLGRTRDTGAAIITPHIEDPTEAARVVLELERQHQEDQESRIQLLRFASVVIGIFLAYLLRIDSADLLRGLLPEGTINFLGVTLIPTGTRIISMTLDHGLTAGIILTGLAASAGSSFWHDQLSRLESVKKTAESAYSTVQNISVKAEQER